MGRSPVRLYRAATRSQGDGRRVNRILPGEHGPLQSAEGLRLPRAAENLDRQDSENGTEGRGEAAQRAGIAVSIASHPNRMRAPSSGIPRSSVPQTSPAATGKARVSVPVVTISPAPS